MSESDRLNRALEDLLADRSPRAEVQGLDADEQRMVRFAQLLRGSRSEEPAPEFVESLHGRLFPETQGVSRRTAFLGAMGALAAGIIGGLGLERAIPPGQKKTTYGALVGKNGRWVSVAAESELPEGAIKSFRASHVQGFLVNRGGQIYALSRICTHMGCQLDFAAKDQAFVCPCHGAEFTLSGELRYGPHGYAIPLPPLPWIDTRRRDGKIEVWSV